MKKKKPEKYEEDTLKFTKEKVVIKKNDYVHILITVICIILFLSVHTFDFILSRYIKLTKNSTQFRTLIISPNYEYDDNGEELISSVEHIINTRITKYGKNYEIDTDLKTSNLDGKITLIYGEKNILPTITIGRTFNEGETNVAICPIDFYPDSLANNTVNSKYIIKKNQSLGKTFTAFYHTYESNLSLSSDLEIVNSYEKKFTIVGLYNNKKEINYANECYISDSDFIEIQDLEHIISEEETEDHNYAFYAVVDKLENIDYVIEELKNMGWDSDDIVISTSMDDYSNEIITTGVNIALFYIILIATILNFIYLKRNLSKETESLKTIEYKKKNVIKKYLYKILAINILSYFIGTLVFLGIYFTLLNNVNVFQLANFKGVDMTLHFNTFAFAFLIFIVLPLILTLFKTYKVTSIKE